MKAGGDKFPKDGGYVLKRGSLPRLLPGGIFCTSDFDMSNVEQRGGEYE